MKVWIEYDGAKKKNDVTLAPITMNYYYRFDVVKPTQPSLSVTNDLSPILKNSMYVGFSSATGENLTSHYVLGWSFKVNVSSSTP